MDIRTARILITGGARGIGNFLASGLLESGSRIFVADKDQDLLSALPAHPQLSKHVCDVTDEGSVAALVEDIFSNHGGVNVLINNAGIIHSELLVNRAHPDGKHAKTSWDKVIDVNLNSVFYVTSNVVRAMVAKREKGVIINISSISAKGNAGQSAYSASKAAVEALTKTWSKELGMYKIRSVCIAPGFFNTPSTRESLSEAILTKWEKSVPLNRLGELDELLMAAKFLIENDYYNGRILEVDGGLTI
jgi:3-oxoacyl-[acyl-carrier protein] reductase